MRLAASSGSGADAAGVKGEVEGAVSELRRTNPNLKVTINPQTGLPTSISGIAPTADTRSLGAGTTGGELTEEETRLAVDRFFGSAGVRSVFKTKNNAAKHEYVGRRRDPDFPGRYIAEVEQRVDGVPVFGSTSKLTVERSLGVTKYSGNTSTVAVDSTTPKIVEAEAVTAARAKVEGAMANAPDASRAFPLPADPQTAEAKAQLIVFDPALVGAKNKGSTRLAWMVSIQAFRVFVDANTGEAFYYYRDQPSGMVRRVYDLASTTTFPGTKIIDEETRERIDDLDSDALLAFHNAGLVRDFYFLVFGRDGYDDNDGPGPLGGAALEAYVRYGRAPEAFWCSAKSFDCPKANVMVYGPGFASSIDIVAHEMTHGIIAHEKNLLYLNEPGAVNESLADIFGSLIELNAKGEGGNWLIGENAPGFSATAPLRSLAHPNLADENGRSMFDRTAPFSLANRGQPDNYADVLTPDDPLCGSTAYEDNGCVHFNSGILNKFAYLIAEGGEHRGVKVTGIGRQKLGRIAYRAMTAGLNQSSDLMQAAQAFTDSCFELANGKLGGFIPADCKQVLGAQQAVGLLAAGS
jgi:Zn-dependent metalloprotease